MCQGFLLVCGKPGSLGGMVSWVVLYAAVVGVVYGLWCVGDSMGYSVVFSIGGSWHVLVSY